MVNSSALRATRAVPEKGQRPVLVRLEKWLKDSGLTQSQAAARAGLCVPVFNRILHGRVAASKAAGFAIERLTDGIVRADDLFHVVPTSPPSGRRRRTNRDAIRDRSFPDDGRVSRNLGPFRSEAAALTFLVGRLANALRPEAIFLFGSRAAAAARPDSDFDLLVVLPDDSPGPPDYFSAYAPIAGSGLGVDVIPCRLADYVAERDQPGTIAFAAAHKGRILYTRPDSQLHESPRRRHSRQ
ncbi:MAG: nucleotidyltransferase domain-containing protein [Rhodospirillales bacterium]|nr:nucleotidyltransferase domain-containing protein [Rhodospirillales bacterium]